jgi:hypothetical protein
MIGVPYSNPYQQVHGTLPWQHPQPGFGGIGGRQQTMYNPYVGTPTATSNAYTNQWTYPTQPREQHLEGTNANRMLLPLQTLPQGGTVGPQPGYMPGAEYYTPQPVHAPGHGTPQPCHMRRIGVPVEPAGSQTMPVVVSGDRQEQSGLQRDTHASRVTNGVGGDSSSEKTPSTGRQATSIVVRRASNTSSNARTSSGGGTLHSPRDSGTEGTPAPSMRNPTVGISTNHSKSSPPYILSQRKQLRSEEKSYLKEVKRSIAEGRVPQVRLQQNNNGEIVQYKGQFLNALKLAALALVPNADIDTKNPCTMQEIMEEVKRQSIIEKPLPEGMVAGFLQRLYKRNRAVYHRHWTLKGDQNRPDECPPAAWLQLVDYWKSMEGSKECERNKANASAKKSSAVRYLPLKPLFWKCCIILYVRRLHVQ